jgi:hypothetical protein
MGASRKEQVQAVLDRVAASLDGIEKPVLREILPVLNRAHEEVTRDLRNWLATQHGADRFTAQRYRNVLVNLDAALGRIEGTGALMAQALKKTGKLAAAASISNFQDEWLSFGKIFEGTVQPIPLDEAIILTRGKKLLWPRFETSAEKYAGGIGDRTRFHLATSRARGETIYELTNRLEKNLPDVFKANRWDAERLARTETMNAYNTFHQEAIIEGHKEDPELLSRWDASYDGRRCPMCASLDGQSVNVAKGEMFVARWTTVTKKGQKLHVLRIKQAPGHPCCRCVETPWRASWAAYARNQREIYEGERIAA